MPMFLECVTCLMVFCTSLTEAANSTTVDFSDLAQLITDLMACRNIPGVSVAIVVEGKTEYVEAFGKKDVATGADMENSTVLCQSDLTQGFTATLAATAISKMDGTVDWDTPLRSVLGPKFTMQDDTRTHRASLRDVLGHRLGISYHRGVAVAGVSFDTKDFAMGKIRHLPEAHKFRAKYEFGTYDYLLAAHVTEALHGRSWDDDVERLFNKIGMTDTILGTKIRQSDWGNNVARSYSYNQTGANHVPNNDSRFLTMTNGRCPAACVWSSGRDMAKWMEFLLRADGKDKTGTEFVKPEVLKQLYEPVIAAPRNPVTMERPRFPFEDTFDTFAMGFQVGTYTGHQKLSQRGFTMNYHCTMALLPDEKAGVWVCTNGPERTTEIRDPSAIIVRFALDNILRRTPFVNGSTACSFPMPWVPLDPAAANDPPGSTPSPQKAVVAAGVLPACWRLKKDNYVGFYMHGAFGNISVRQHHNGELHYTFGEMLKGALVISVAPDIFLMTFDEPFKDVYPDERYTLVFQAKCCVNIQSVKVDFLGYPGAPVFKKLSSDPYGPPVTTATPKIWPTRMSSRGPQTVAPSGGSFVSAAVAVVLYLLNLRQ